MTTEPTTYVVRISARYAFDHIETSSMPGTYVGENGRGVELELTLGELYELRSRADYYADPNFRRELAESGLEDIYRSAVKVCEQLRRAGLWELARSKEASAAYDAEWTAAHATA
jgi:hypothetical protein